jgi:cell division protein FtsA
MARKTDKSLVVGLDIGTSKIVAIVGEIQPDGGVEVIGLGSHASRGLKRGMVVDIESTEQSIQRAVEEAELMADCEIHSVFAGIAGTHVSSSQSSGAVAIRDSEVTDSDVERVLESARAVAIPADQRILHVLPKGYVIDSTDGIRQPVGMSGVRLEVQVHLVTAANSAVQNVTKCVARCGLQVDDLILHSLASAEAVLSEDEKELGIGLIDIGAGTTDIAVFAEGAIQHTACIPIAGDLVTSDIAVALRTPTLHAEEIKIKYACALEQLASSDETLQVPSVGDRAPQRLERQTLAQVVEARYRELFHHVQKQLRQSGCENLVPAGLVLTGGGARMEGVVELAEEIMHMPVRLGAPQHIRGLSEVVDNPIHSTGVGLLLRGSRLDRPRSGGLGRGSASGGLVSRLKQWFQGEF